MRNLSIKAKLAVAFALLLAIVVGLGSFALNRLALLDNLLSGVGTRALPSVAVLGQMGTTVANIRIVETLQIGGPPGDELARLRRTLEQRVDSFAGLQRSYERLIEDPRERATYDKFSREWQQYQAIGKRVTEFAVARQDDRAGDLFAGDSAKSYERLAATLDQLVRINQEDAAAAHRQAQAIYGASKRMVIGTIAVALALTLFLAWLSMTTLADPIRAMTSVMSRLAEGGDAGEIPSTDRNDELGRMAQAVRVFRERIEENRRLEAEARQAQDRADTQRKAAVLDLAAAFESSVKSVVDGVSASAEQVHSASQALSAVAEQSETQTSHAASAAGEASTSVQMVSAAAGQLSASIIEIGRQVEVSAKVSRDAVSEARRADGLMASLAEAAGRIGNVVALINDIAAQTNLLALNATIEAARAGDAGKGFAVVANEVKTLANQTAKATDEISQQVSSVQEATREAVRAIESVTGIIGQLNDIAVANASAVEEQGTATGEIARNAQQAALGTERASGSLQGVRQGAMDTGRASRELLSAAEGLTGQASRLRRDVDQFISTIRTG